MYIEITVILTNSSIGLASNIVGYGRIPHNIKWVKLENVFTSGLAFL